MIFYTVNKFVSEILSINPEVKNIVIAYLLKENAIDKFNKVIVKPLLIVLETDNDKIKMNYDQILEQFGEAIAINLVKETTEKLGVALCSISTQAKTSKKFNVDYYQKQFLTPGPKLIKEVNDIYKKKEETKAQIYDF